MYCNWYFSLSQLWHKTKHGQNMGHYCKHLLTASLFHTIDLGITCPPPVFGQGEPGIGDENRIRADEAKR